MIYIFQYCKMNLRTKVPDNHSGIFPLMLTGTSEYSIKLEVYRRSKPSVLEQTNLIFTKYIIHKIMFSMAKYDNRFILIFFAAVSYQYFIALLDFDSNFISLLYSYCISMVITQMLARLQLMCR